MPSAFQGSIFDLSINQATSGDSVQLSIRPGVPAEFRPTSQHQAFLVPLNPPPGLASTTTFFGYRLTIQIVDSHNARVVIPALGTDPLVAPVEGPHKIAVVTGRDWGDTIDTLQLRRSASTSSSRAPVGGTGLGGGFIIPTPGRSAPALGSGGIPVPTLPPGAGGSARIPVAVPSPTLPPAIRPVATGPAAVVSPPAIRNPNPTPTAVRGTTMSTGATASSPDPDDQDQSEQLAETCVEWVVERLTPRRVQGAAADMIEEADAIVSARVMTPDRIALVNKSVTMEIIEETRLAGDDSEVLEVANKIEPLERNLDANISGTGRNSGKTNDDGKIFCRLRVRLIDESVVADDRDRLLGLRIIIGDRSSSSASASPPATPSGASALMMRAPVGAGSLAQALEDILVEPDEFPVVTWTRMLGRELVEAVAGIPRTPQRIIGFHLERVADYVLLTNAPMFLGNDSARATVVGMLLGIPRGGWVSATDQIEDIKMLVFDLPRALYNWFAADPLFALKVTAAALVPGFGIVEYNLDDDFKAKIDDAFKRLAGTTENFIVLLQQLYPIVRDNAQNLTVMALEGFYNSFDTFVGSIATDYLDYKRDSQSHRSFVLGFMGGDFFGYVAGTIGITVAIGYLTSGIGTWIQALGKLARLRRIADPIIKLAAAINRVRAAIQAVATQLRLTAKGAWGYVVTAITRLLSNLADDALDPVFRLLSRADDAADRFLKMLLKYVRENVDRCDGLIEGVGALRQAGVSDDSIESALSQLARQAEGPDGFVPAC